MKADVVLVPEPESFGEFWDAAEGADWLFRTALPALLDNGPARPFRILPLVRRLCRAFEMGEGFKLANVDDGGERTRGTGEREVVFRYVIEERYRDLHAALRARDRKAAIGHLKALSLGWNAAPSVDQNHAPVTPERAS